MLISANRIPIALQWMFPTPLLILVFFAPESPWWLVRKGRLEEAARSVERLGRKSRTTKSSDTVAMMRRTIDLEKSQKKPSLLELFKGTDLRRTLIVCGVYAAQNLTGNLIANQAVYFFTRKWQLTVRSLPYADQARRGRCWPQHCFRPRTHHLRPSNDLCHAFLDSHHFLRSPYHLPVGFGSKHDPPCCPRYRRLGRCLNIVQLRRGISRLDRLCALHFGPCSRFLGYHRRDIRHPPQAPHHWHGSCHILHC